MTGRAVMHTVDSARSPFGPPRLRYDDVERLVQRLRFEALSGRYDGTSRTWSYLERCRAILVGPRSARRSSSHTTRACTHGAISTATTARAWASSPGPGEM